MMVYTSYLIYSPIAQVLLRLFYSSSLKTDFKPHHSVIYHHLVFEQFYEPELKFQRMASRKGERDDKKGVYIQGY